MKKLLTILVVIMMPIVVFGQQKIKKQPIPLAKYDDNVNLPLTAEERAQIIEVYGEFANKYVFSNENRLKSIKHILRNRVVFKKITDTNEMKECPLLSEVSLFNKYVPTLKRDEVVDPENFNPLKYNFQFYTTEASMVKVDNTDYYIIIKSQHE